MRKLMSVVAVAFAGFAVANASEETNFMNNNTEIISISVSDMVAQDSVKRTQVEIADLPEAVVTTLTGEEFLGWNISSAYFVEQEGTEPYYEITLIKEDEDEPKVVRLDVNGKLL